LFVFYKIFFGYSKLTTIFDTAKKNMMSKPSRTDRQVLALIRAAKKYPKCKGKIKQIRQQQAWNKFLAQ